MSERKGGAVILIIVLAFLPHALRAQEESDYDWGQWTGIFMRFNPDKALDLSTEYQVRLGDNFRSLKSHYLEGMGYLKLTKSLELAGGYRLTLRPDHTEHRLFVLGWWGDMGILRAQSSGESPGWIFNHHAGYQRDFNVKFNDKLIQSNSVRYLLSVYKPLYKKTAVFVRGGVLLTWNEEYSFALDKIRLIIGLRIFRNKTDRLLVQYMWEESRSVSPWKHTNVIWIRYLIVK